ncbi:cytochrome c oxidase assembly factor Coa1 family protein [Maribacter sp. 2308TA10-17]|uniref:cytochrome c oxidase assembly factor Coa1 family protein n=1 Tax=Maribacter sp. 2308TA10-17 TaxID=3386276 RepID=UPI0039BCFBC9
MNNELVEYPSWWKRNWKWVVPVGGCLSLIVLFIVFLGSVFYGVTSALEESQPYEYALEKINQDPEIASVLGTPIEKDGMIQGNYKYSNGKKSADMKIPISGPNGSGTLFVEATGEDDNWTYNVIRVEIKDNESIDLLEGESEMF